MKRQNHLIEQITDYNNIRGAYLKALRGNRNSTDALAFARHLDRNLGSIREKLASGQCNWGNYRSFQIYDPKLRIISVAPFEQRVMHHALMNILEPIFERPMIYHSYACRKNKGTHAAVLYAFHQCKHNSFFLKLDVRHYFDSIDHATLKNILKSLIKDKHTLAILYDLVDSFHPPKGVPIGNLTSQFFANLYLAGLDHYILEKFHPAAYCRYMDDIVLWAPSIKDLQAKFAIIKEHALYKLKLDLKEPVYGAVKHGLPFLGFLIKNKGIYLLQKSRLRVKNRMHLINRALACGVISEEEAAQRASSVYAAIKLARTYSFRAKIIEQEEMW
jgi:retron-type reverse transcriptase